MTRGGRTDLVLGSNLWDQAGGSIFLCFDSPSSKLVRGTAVGIEFQDLSSRALLVHVPSQRHEYAVTTLKAVAMSWNRAKWLFPVVDGFMFGSLDTGAFAFGGAGLPSLGSVGHHVLGRSSFLSSPPPPLWFPFHLTISHPHLVSTPACIGKRHGSCRHYNTHRRHIPAAPESTPHRQARPVS